MQRQNRPAPEVKLRHVQSKMMLLSPRPTWTATSPLNELRHLNLYSSIPCFIFSHKGPRFGRTGAIEQSPARQHGGASASSWRRKAGIQFLLSGVSSGQVWLRIRGETVPPETEHAVIAILALVRGFLPGGALRRAVPR